MADVTDARFLDGYLEAMAFTDFASDDECADCDLSDELRDRAKADCEAFQRDAAELLAEAYARDDYGAEQAGRDFWLTRCGHGVGFWDRCELTACQRVALFNAATNFGNLDVYRGDDGLAYTI